MPYLSLCSSVNLSPKSLHRLTLSFPYWLRFNWPTSYFFFFKHLLYAVLFLNSTLGHRFYRLGVPDKYLCSWPNSHCKLWHGLLHWLLIIRLRYLHTQIHTQIILIHPGTRDICFFVWVDDRAKHFGRKRQSYCTQQRRLASPSVSVSSEVAGYSTIMDYLYFTPLTHISQRFLLFTTINQPKNYNW